MPFTPDTFTNQNITGTSTVAGGSGGLGTALNPSDTTLRLPTGHGSRFPAIAPFSLQLGTTEIAKCTLRSGDTLTIVRGQEGTTAGNWAVGTTVQQVLTAGNLSDVFSAVQVTALGVYNVRSATYGAVGDGVTDDTSAIQAAVTAAGAAGGGTVRLPSSATYLISAPLTVSSANVRLVGDGRGNTILKAAAGFSGAAMVLITGAYCSVEHLSLVGGPNLSSATNPVANGIEISAAKYARVANLEATYINGYTVEITATSAAGGTYGAMLDSIHVLHCAGGIHTLGNAVTNYGIQAWLSNLNLEICDSLDCILLEDSRDIVLVNINGAAGQGAATNSMLHILGASGPVYGTNLDMGVFPGPANAPTVTIESGANGAPKYIYLYNFSAGAGSMGVSVNGGSVMALVGGRLTNNATYGLQLAGFPSDLLVSQCTFDLNGQTAGASRYDINANSNGSGLVIIDGNVFRGAIGSSAGQVNGNIWYGSGTQFYVRNNVTSAGAAFMAHNIPPLVRHNVGYNPIGSVTAPAFPATTVAATNSTGYDVTAYIANGTSAITQIQIAGAGGSFVTTGLQIAASGWGTVRLPAGAQVKFTYAGGTPTWTFFGD